MILIFETFSKHKAFLIDKQKIKQIALDFQYPFFTGEQNPVPYF